MLNLQPRIDADKQPQRSREDDDTPVKKVPHLYRCSYFLLSPGTRQAKSNSSSKEHLRFFSSSSSFISKEASKQRGLKLRIREEESPLFLRFKRQLLAPLALPLFGAPRLRHFGAHTLRYGEDSSPFSHPSAEEETARENLLLLLLLSFLACSFFSRLGLSGYGNVAR